MNREVDNESPVIQPLGSTHQPDVISSGSTSFSKTCFNLLNSLSGIGILSIPYAVASAGWLSLILLLVIAITSFYTGLLIQRCMDIDPNVITYPDIGYRAFGRKGKVFVSIITNLELYLVATGFLILEGDNLHKIFPHMKFNIGSLVIGGRQGFVIIIGIIILPTVWWNTMNILSYISANGVLSSFILLGSIFWTGAVDGVGFNGKGTLLNLKGIPISVSLFVFCYCAHPIFPTICASMRNQKKFSKVLLICFLVCTITYTSMAVLGYSMFGSKVESQVTLNLPTDKISSKVAIFTTIISPITKYALMVTPILRAVENRFPAFKERRLLNIVLKSAMVISSVVIAVEIPLFGYLMALVGAFLSATSAIILPCVCYLKIYGIHRKFGFEWMFIGGIIAIGSIIIIVGTYISLKEIIRHLMR